MNREKLIAKIADKRAFTRTGNIGNTLANEIIELFQSHTDDESILLVNLLREICDIVKGKPPEGTLYSFHDLPKLVRGLKPQESKPFDQHSPDCELRKE